MSARVSLPGEELPGRANAEGEFRLTARSGLGFARSPATCPTPASRSRRRVYSQGAPEVFKGDLHDHAVDHDLGPTVAQIDTSRVAVVLLTGEYDWSPRPLLAKILEASAKA